MKAEDLLRRDIAKLRHELALCEQAYQCLLDAIKFLSESDPYARAAMNRAVLLRAGSE